MLSPGSIVRILGKKLVIGFDKEDSDFPPYNKKEQKTFPEFIIGIDDRGKEIRSSCDPHGGIDYLHPVFFRSEVLNRYYDNPSKYSVEDGYLRCGGLWGISIDNDNPDYVTVFLGDLGRDLPQSERPYWQTFNIAPVGKMSTTSFQRNLMAEFADPTRKDLVFKSTLDTFLKNWQQKMGWQLFRDLSAADKHCLISLRIPATDEQNEFDTQVMYLTKILVDSINEKELGKHISVTPDQKGISKLENYLKLKGAPNYSSHVQFLRDLQSLRSSGAAHLKGDNYRKITDKVGSNHNDVRAVFENLLGAAINLLKDLETLTP